MPNFKEHLKLGAVVGLGIKIFITGLQQKEQGFFDLRKLLHEGLKGAVLGAIGAIIPDILEPASQPHHRGIFHSFFVMSIFAYARFKAKNPELNSFIDGYLSHLVADLGTPKGLPFI